MTESEVRKLLRQMKEWSSQTAFRRFYDLTYDRLFRIAYYYVKREEWAQEIVLDVFLKLWEQRNTLPEVRNIEDYCFILVKNASLNYLEKEMRRDTLTSNELPDETEGASRSPEEEMIGEEPGTIEKALERHYRRELLDIWLRYEGLIGYTGEILHVMEALGYDIDTEE